MLSRQGNAGELTVKNNNMSNQQKSNFVRAAHFFCTILCSCFARLQRESSRNLLQLHILWRKCRTCSHLLFFTAAHFHLPLVAASISYFLTATAKFSCCSSNKKNVSFVVYLLLQISLPFSRSFVGLPPTFSFSLSFSCSIFQICGHDN